MVTQDAFVYSRLAAPNSTRLETVLTALLHAPCITYSSGLAALHALYVFLQPKRVSIGIAYHGSHRVLGIHTKLAGTKLLPLDCPASDLQKGDVIHLETPMNPTGEALNIATYAEKAHARGAYLVVDATFGPPGLQEPFKLGADVVMHSGTKYLGGHGDLLCGVLACPRADWIHGLLDERTYLGSVMGNLEAWLGVRSLRTLELRVQRQSETASALVAWLDNSLRDANPTSNVRAVVSTVQHASLQKSDMAWLVPQMPRGFGPVFAIRMRTEALARRLPSTLRLFRHASSLGGVESLIEWRAMSDPGVDPRLLRISVGVEDEGDLRRDLEGGFRVLRGDGGDGGDGGGRGSKL